MKTARGILVCSALGLLVSAGLGAVTYLPLSDQDLARRSPVILRAIVQGSAVRVESVDGQDLPFTVTTLQLLERLKGFVGDGPIEVRLPGGRVGDRAWWLPGTPVFKNGQEVLVFLEPRAGHPGEYHLSEFGLGHFDILTDRASRRFAVRPAFEPTEDLFLGTLGPEPGEILPERAVLRRDAESLFAMARCHAPREPIEDVVLAPPSGDLKGPLEARPEWVNLGGAETGGNLFRWFWDLGVSPNAVVSVNGTQTNLSDSSDGTAHVTNGINQWDTGVPATDIRISGITGGGNITVTLDATTSFDGTTWTTSLPCTTGGVIGLGGPSAIGPSRTFKGDSPYFACVSGQVSMRKLTGSAGCYTAAVFRTAVMHELGHVLGLGHPDQANSNHSTTTAGERSSTVMTSSVPPSMPSTPQSDDIQGMQFYYGTGGGSPPTANFTFSPPSPTAGATVSFTDTSTGSPTSWSWTFGDGTFSTAQSPFKIYGSPGIFSVTLTASNGNGSTQRTQFISISASGSPPAASFGFSPGSPSVGQGVQFTDTSTGSPTTWSWDFGDSQGSSLQNPTHVYAAAGTYTASLTALNAFGSSNTTRLILVKVATPCPTDAGTLPANAGHNFCITLSARDQRTGNVGAGLAIPQNNLFGYFSIPALTSNPDNPEVFVKVLDGRVVNGFFWVFYGGLTDLEYTITVLDFQTGLTRQYHKPPFTTDGGFDTLAFAGSSTVDPPPGAATSGSAAAPIVAGCTGDSATLCLNSSHGFFVSLAARDQRTDHTGPGQAIPQNDIFGYFSIPALTSNPDNPEVFVKVLDGRVVNGHFWVFYGGLTDLEYTITVREISTGLIKTYFKPAGSAAGGFDTSAF